MITGAHRYLSGQGLGPLFIKTLIGSAGMRLLGMFFGFLVGVQLARGLGIDGYGIYGLAMSIIAVLTVPTEFGLPQLVTREVAAAQVNKDWGRLHGILSWSNNTVLLISGAISIAVLFWLMAAGRSLDASLTKTLLVGMSMIPLVALANLRSAALRGLQHIVKGQAPDTLIRPAVFSLLLLVASLSAVSLQPVLAMALGTVSAVVALVISVIMLRNNRPTEIGKAPRVVQSHAWWKSALPMALSEGMRVLQSHLAILLLGLMATLPMVGVYKVASSVVLLIGVPGALANVVGAPLIARLYAQRDMATLQYLLSWLALGMTSCTLLLCLPFVIDGQSLLSFIFGREFGEANAVLLVLCLGAVISSFFGVNFVLLNMTGHQSRVTRASTVSLGFFVVITPPLILVSGEIGAAIATTLSMTIWSLVMWRDALRLLALDASVLSFLKSAKRVI